MNTPDRPPTLRERISNLFAQLSQNAELASAVKQADSYTAKGIAKLTELLGRLRAKK